MVRNDDRPPIFVAQLDVTAAARYLLEAAALHRGDNFARRVQAHRLSDGDVDGHDHWRLADLYVFILELERESLSEIVTGFVK